MAYVAEFAALIGLASLFVLPIGPVPVTLQVLVIAFCGLFLGSRAALVAVALYLLAGCVGVPVFAGGKAGFGVLLGPSGGYLIGFLSLAYFSGKARDKSFFVALLILFFAVVSDHLFGIAGLCLTLHKTVQQAFFMDLVFLPGDIVKIFLALLFWRMTRRRLSV